MEKGDRIICINNDNDSELELFKIYTIAIDVNKDSEFLFLRISDSHLKRYEQKNFMTLLDYRKHQITKIKERICSM